MRLSGRSEMKLSGKTVYEGPRGEYEWDLLKGRTHKLSDVLNQLKKTRVDASDERVCLAMLLLVESILLPKNSKGTFPLEYVNKAKDMMYPWKRRLPGAPEVNSKSCRKPPGGYFKIRVARLSSSIPSLDTRVHSLATR
ncbi:unnamed protein product [Brassica oleracea]